MNKTPLLLALVASLGMAGCSTLVPKNTAVAPAIPAQWPAEASQGEVTDVAALGWRDFFTDERLQQVIGQALDNNRDLRVAVLNVEKARGQYRVQAKTFLADASGHSRISYADYGAAFVAELEAAKYPKQIITAAY